MIAAWLLGACENPEAPRACRVIPEQTVVVEGLSVVSACFEDPNGDVLNYDATVSDPGVATVSVDGRRVAVKGVAPGTTVVTVTATDATQLTADLQFEVVVPNRAPMAVGEISPRDVASGEPELLDLSAYFFEPDGQPLTYVVSVSDENVLGISVRGSEAILEARARGVAGVTATATDPGRLSASQTFLVTVPNRTPAATDALADLELLQDSFTIDLSGHFGDPDGDELFFVAETSDSGVATAARWDGGIVLAAVGGGLAEITVSARDPGGLAASESFEVRVPDRPSVVTDSLPLLPLIQGDEAAIDLTAHFRDPEQRPLRFAAESTNPAVATAMMSGITLDVTGVAAGTTTIAVTAHDTEGLLTSQHFEVTVPDNPDRAALVALYESASGRDWRRNDNWLTDAPLNRWYGVRVGGGRVTSLRLANQGLWGRIPPEFVFLDRLENLNLSDNSLIGGIPPWLGRFEHLQALDLGFNRLSGAVPPELGRLARLKSLLLDRNRLTGTIPAELGDLASLEILELWHNHLTGPVPPSLGNLEHLTGLDLGGNQLTGTVPSVFGDLRKLRKLLVGPVPAELGRLAKLQALWLQRNYLEGPVPATLGDLDALVSLVLLDNSLSGPIPRSFLQLDGLIWLYLRENDGLCLPGTGAFAAWAQRRWIDEDRYCNASDKAGLEELHHSTGGAGWRNQDGWLAGAVLETWHGVATDSLGRVRRLDLGGNGLVGRLPSGLGQRLDQMTSLRIGDNQLSGPLPQSLVGVPLDELHYENTDLCIPPDESFRRWLDAIPSHRGTGVECPPLSDREILTILYETTGGPNWTHRENWLSDEPLGRWYGVHVYPEDRVRRLVLQANGHCCPWARST